jgi:diguanylate cyclase (GGDEF)-like protein
MMDGSVRSRIDAGNRQAWDLMLSDPEGARLLVSAVLAEAVRAGYAEGQADAHLNIGWCEHYLTHMGPAIESFQKSLAIFETLSNSLGLMKAYNALGVAYHDIGRYETAMDYYTRSLEEARRRGNFLREAVTLNNIGEICLERGDIKEGLDYFLRAYEAEVEDPELVANVLLNLGTSFHRMENWSLAKDFSEKALAITRESGDRHLEAQALLGLGKIARASDDLAGAETHYLAALALTEELKNEKWHVNVLLELGSLDAARGDLESALEHYRNALAGAEILETKSLLKEAYERLSEVHEALGNFQIALDYYRRHARYERESLSEDTSRKIKNITVQYEVEKSRQESEIYRLKNIELKEKTAALEEINRQLLSISDLGRKVTSSLDLDTVLQTVKESLERHLDATVFGIAVYIEDEDTLDWKIFFDRGRRLHRPLARLDPKRSMASWCIRHREAVFINDAEAEYQRYLEGSRSIHGLPSSSLIFIPLVIEERVIGILTVQSYEKYAYKPQHRVLVEALGPYIGIAIENSLIHDRLADLNQSILGEKAELEKKAIRTSHLANHDSLTGLPNRRLLFELLQKSFDIAARNGTKVGIIYVDLDDFKPINDRFGHLAGDAALIEIADRLRGMMRSSDTVARVGGDEFVIVLTNVKERADGELALAKIGEVGKRPLVIGDTECSVGLSMGVSIFPDDGGTIEEILGRADAAMYSVKSERKRGRTPTELEETIAEAPPASEVRPAKRGRGNRR